MISSKYTIREQNEATLLKSIIEKESISRAELSVITGLNKASVSSITKKLMDDNLVIETGTGAASTIGGRKPILLAFNPTSALAISIDLGYNYIRAMLTHLDGSEISSVNNRRIDIHSKNVIELLCQTIQKLEKDIVSTTHGIIGITIAIHGVVFENKIVFTPYYDLDKVDIVEQLSKVFSYPILIENEANLTAIGEYCFSSNFDSLISISIHSGVGAGIVEDGNLQHGKHGKAGEIGHSILFPNGIICPCGNKGCLEQYASNRVLIRNISKIKQLDFVNTEIIAELFYAQDEDVLEQIKEFCTYLSIGINNIVTTYDPEVVVIHSSLFQEIPEMIEIIKSKMNSHFSNKVKISNSLLEDRATLLGALALTCQNFLNIQKLKISPHS